MGTGGIDRTCRLWKIAEESQLVFTTYDMAIESCGILSSTKWVTGDQHGCICLWSKTKKNPIFTTQLATKSFPQLGAGSIMEACTKWVLSLSVCEDAELIAAGMGDGEIRLIKVSTKPENSSLTVLGGIPARGFVNGVKLARSARFLLAGVGQQPRLGSWASDKSAENGLLLHSLNSFK